MDKLQELYERDEWLVRQLDNCIADADALVSVTLDGKGMRALRDDLKDARNALVNITQDNA